MVRISFIIALCVLLSGCQAFKTLSTLTGQSGGTQNNITVPIGDNKKKAHAGDEFNIETLSHLTVTNVGDWLKDLHGSITLMLTISIFCLLMYFRQRAMLRLLKQLANKKE